MSVDLSDPHLQEVCKRANVLGRTDTHTLAEQISTACKLTAEGTEAILDISRAGLHKTADGHALGSVDALIVLFRFEFAIVQQKGVFRKTWTAQRVEFDNYVQALADEHPFGDKTGESAIQFLGAGAVPIFRLGWSWWRRTLSQGTAERLQAAEERDRILSAINAAKMGDFMRWGQLPSQPSSFADDFHSFYVRMKAEGPADPNQVAVWAKESIGEAAYPSALSFAIEWREDELRDQRPLLERGGVSARVRRICASAIVTDRISESKQVFLELGEALYTRGELAGPYDERAYFGPGVQDDAGEELASYDPGPSRLNALIRLCAYGYDLDHPRTAEWVTCAKAGLATVPPAALPESCQREWNRINLL